MPSKTTEENFEERFWKKVERIEDEDSCWLWTGSKTGKTKNGRGYFRAPYVKAPNRLFWASRISYYLANGLFDESLCVCHCCDNSFCVRPSHLFLGTHRENMEDMKRKGRARSVPSKGDANPLCRIRDSEVLEIISRYQQGEKLSELAESFSCSITFVSSVVNGRRRRQKSAKYNEDRDFTKRWRKVPKEKFEEIQRRVTEGESRQIIADEFGITYGHVGWLLKQSIPDAPC